MSTGPDAGPNPVEFDDLEVVPPGVDGSFGPTIQFPTGVDSPPEIPLAARSARCPYPDCTAGKTGDLSARELWNGLFSCAVCGRVSAVCSRPDCETRQRGELTLNRPFVRYCRRCGMPQESSVWNMQSVWRRIHDLPAMPSAAMEQATPGSRAGLPEVVHSIPHYEYTENSSPVRSWQLTWADGLLAAQASGYAPRLIHPFANPFDGQPATARPHWQGQGWGESQGGGGGWPYPPRLTRDRRFVLFSTTQGVHPVDLWKIAGWGTQGMNSPTTELQPQAAGQLVAPPVALTGPQVNEGTGSDGASLVGTLWRKQPRAAVNGDVMTLVWRVDDLNGNSPSPVSECEFELRGSALQIVSAEDQLLIVASDREFKWWTWTDSVALNSNSILSGPKLPEAETVLLEKRWLVGRGFCDPMLHAVGLIPGLDEEASGDVSGGTGVQDRGVQHRTGRLQFCFATRGGTEDRVLVCDLNAARRTTSLPIPLETKGLGMRPIGVVGPELYILGRKGLGGGATIYRRTMGTYSPLEHIPEIAPRVEDVEGIQVMHERVVLVIKSAEASQRGADEWDVEVYSAGKRQKPAPLFKVRGLPLLADPLVVGPYLFTMERGQNCAQLLRRSMNSWKESPQ